MSKRFSDHNPEAFLVAPESQANDVCLKGIEASKVKEAIRYSKRYEVLQNDWVPYIPIWTSVSDPQPAIVGGTLEGKYLLKNRICHLRIKLAFAGSTTYGTGNTWWWSAPWAYAQGHEPLGLWKVVDTSTGIRYTGVCRIDTSALVHCILTGTNTHIGNDSRPMGPAWAGTDTIQIQIDYPY